jgi:group I intron endonuclease
MKVSGIYKIENAIDGKVYVGSAVNLAKRRRDHFAALAINKHINYHLQRAWNKYGAENFLFVELELCTRDQLITREQYYLDTLNACAFGYNIAPTAGSSLGRVHSEDTKKKISGKAIGRITGPCSDERRKNISLGHIGKKQTEEHNRKAIEGRLRNGGYHHTAESRKKISEAQKGKVKPAGMGEKVSMALTGRPKSPEHRQHLSESKIGKPGTPHTAEWKRKMSESHKGVVLSFESIQKMRETKRRNFLLKKQIQDQQTGISVGL